MAEIIARFADGRLLVQESRVCEKAYDTTLLSGENYADIGAAIRVGHVKTIEKVLSVDSEISGYPGDKVVTRLQDISISGDILYVKMRRGDLGVPASGYTYPVASGGGAYSMLSGITSGCGWYSELASGIAAISGKVTVMANVIGF